MPYLGHAPLHEFLYRSRSAPSKRLYRAIDNQLRRSVRAALRLLDGVVLVGRFVSHDVFPYSVSGRVMEGSNPSARPRSLGVATKPSGEVGRLGLFLHLLRIASIDNWPAS